MNSSIPVVKEFDLDLLQVFEYFNLHIPAGPIATKRGSYPIALDIRTRIWTLRVREPNRFARTSRPPSPPPAGDDEAIRRLRRRRQ